ncbi:hypothetical protein J2S21_002597 [Peribacillus cavernae]|nr:hypothetical protein [Peribacillus cavernae]
MAETKETHYVIRLKANKRLAAKAEEWLAQIPDDNLHNGFRRLCLPKDINKKLIDTVRLQLIKIAGKIIRSGRYLTFKLSSHCLYQKEFKETLRRIQMLPRFG